MTVRVLAASGLTTEKDPDLDLDDPETNFMAMMKIRGDLCRERFLLCFSRRGLGDAAPGKARSDVFALSVWAPGGLRKSRRGTGSIVVKFSTTWMPTRARSWKSGATRWARR